MYQVSTMQALASGYSKKVIKVEELLREGDTGLGTFEDVNGEMIVLDGKCYRADQDGNVRMASPEMGVPFAAVAGLYGEHHFSLKNVPDMEFLKKELTEKIDECSGLNSMHIVRIDGYFEKIDARSEAPYRPDHRTPLKEILSHTQKAFLFKDIRGSLAGVYYPEHMDGINMPGWHLHFISEDRSKGGHVFDLCMREGDVKADKIRTITIDLPDSADFGTFSFRKDLNEEIRSVE